MIQVCKNHVNERDICFIISFILSLTLVKSVKCLKCYVLLRVSACFIMGTSMC